MGADSGADPGTDLRQYAQLVGAAAALGDLAGVVEAGDLHTPAAVGRLAGAGEMQVTQRGDVVDVATARGPVRVRRPR